MSPKELRALSDQQLVEMLVALRPDGAAIAWLASAVSDEDAFEGVRELRRRFIRDNDKEAGKVNVHHRNANTVTIDASRFKAWAYRNRLTLTAVGPMFGRCEGWMSAVCTKGHAGYYALDELASSMDMRVEDLIAEIGTEAELARLSA